MTETGREAMRHGTPMGLMGQAAASALGQHAHGHIDVTEGAGRAGGDARALLLARFAQAVQRVVGQRGESVVGEEVEQPV